MSVASQSQRFAVKSSQLDNANFHYHQQSLANSVLNNKVYLELAEKPQSIDIFGLQTINL
mgnify:CR=1 FL=1